jgi:hypothetical protein
MVAARIRAPQFTSRQALLSVLGGVALVAAAAGIRSKFDTAGPTPAVAAPAVREPLYVLPPQPADLARTTVVATPASQQAPWELTLMTARHPEP